MRIHTHISLFCWTFLLVILIILPMYGQDLDPLPDSWVKGTFTDTTITFSVPRVPPPDTVFAKTAPDDWALSNIITAEDFDSIYYHLGDSFTLKKHAKEKDGDDVFDYTVDKDAMAHYKLMYSDSVMFVFLVYIDLNHQFTDHGWEICWQTKHPLYYEPDYLSATDDTLRKKSYARYTAMGGGKAMIENGIIKEVAASNGVGHFRKCPIADSIMTDTNRTPLFWDDDGNGIIRTIVPIDFDAFDYLDDPATGDINNPDDYISFDPIIKPLINWDLKTRGNVDGKESHYWWDAPSDFSYAINYYGGRLVFTGEPVFGLDATLKLLMSDSTEVVGFDKDSTHYSVILPIGTTVTPPVIAIPTDRYAKTIIIPATNVKGDSLERTTIIEVTAHNDTVKKLYSITYTVLDNYDASLSDISIGGNTIHNFDSLRLHYSIHLPSCIDSIPWVTGILSDTNATMSISQATDLKGDSASRTATIHCIAEDDTTEWTYSITFNLLPKVSAQIQTLSNYNGYPIRCHNLSDSIKVKVSGGTPPYSFQWGANTGGQTNAIVRDLVTGIYHVTATDADNCSADTSIEMNAPNQLFINESINAVSCYGAKDGSIVINGIGGVQAYEYTWNHGDTNSSPKNLDIGYYFLTMTDANGCSVSDSFEIIQPPEISVNKSITFPYCPESYDGKIELNATGGNGNFIYSWILPDNIEPDYETYFLDYISAGTYIYSITDSKACIFNDTIILKSLNEACKLEMYNVITPNGDGINDEWNISENWVYNDESIFPGASIKIFDRYGRLVFNNQNNYANKFTGVDSNGNELPAGSYFYIIEKSNGTKPIKGVVSIIREP